MTVSCSLCLLVVIIQHRTERRGPGEVLSPHLLQGAEGTHPQAPIRIDDAHVEIPTEHLPKRSPERYRCADPFGVVVKVKR